jgi:hypothetical protein
MAAVLLEPGTRLLHIGPHKTGTTAIQGALHLARGRLAVAGVVYPGRGRQPLWPILAITGQPALLGRPSPEISSWENLVRDVRAAGDQRVVLSSEFFAEADDATARRVIADLGGARVHVVLTLRPLTRILPSQWQQYLQNGFHFQYLEWLEGILSDPPRTPTPGFWRRHRHDELVERWAAENGPDNLTVIVVDESDRLMLLRAFESLLGLPAGFLVPGERAANRSLTRWASCPRTGRTRVRRPPPGRRWCPSRSPPGPSSVPSSPAGRAARLPRRSCANSMPGAWRRWWPGAAGNGCAGPFPARPAAGMPGGRAQRLPGMPGWRHDRPACRSARSR